MTMGCSKEGLYGLQARNESYDYGVILLKPEFKGYKPPKLSTDFPSPSNNRIFNRLNTMPARLPDQFEVVWQLAELTECTDIKVIAELPNHKRASGCKFTPMSEKIFSKTIDMHDIYNSKEGIKAGTLANWSLMPGGNSYYILNLTLVFNNDQLHVEWNMGKTNPLSN